MSTRPEGSGRPNTGDTGATRIPGKPSESAERDLRILRLLLQEGETAFNLFIDDRTGLPSPPLLLAQLQEQLRDRSQVAIITLYVRLGKRAQLTDSDVLDRLDSVLAQALQDIKNEQLRTDDYIAELSVTGGSFALVLSPPRSGGPISRGDVENLRVRLAQEIENRINAEFPAEVADRFEFLIGADVMDRAPDGALGRLILRGLNRAFADAFSHVHQREAAERHALRKVLDAGEVSVLFQPIVDCENRTTLGYEALARGPNGAFESPAKLFEQAAQSGLLWQLERLVRGRVLEVLPDLPSDCVLFLNVDAESVFDPKFRELGTAGELTDRTVFELTERVAVRDLKLLRRVVSALRSAGIQFAIDDVGSGYSSLELLAQTQPDFIKLDRSLIAEIESNEIKQYIARMLFEFTDRLGSVFIAEGVETFEQYVVLRKLGVRYMQGFLFARPRSGFPAVDWSGFSGEGPAGA